MFDDLQSLLDTHRKQAFLTCDKHCFCWDVENFISCHEQAGGTTTLAPMREKLYPTKALLETREN